MSEHIAYKKDKFMELLFEIYMCVCMFKSSWNIYLLLWTMVKKNSELIGLSCGRLALEISR